MFGGVGEVPQTCGTSSMGHHLWDSTDPVAESVERQPYVRDIGRSSETNDLLMKVKHMLVAS